jgi:hypothetical protein
MAEITFAQVNEKGQLVLLLSDDRVLNVGNVVGPAGATGNQGSPGVPGPKGKDGAEIFLSAGPPDPAQGKPGDIAIDTVAWKLYQKSGMGWGMGNDMMPGANNLDAAVRRFNGGGGSGGGRFFAMGAPSSGLPGTSGGSGLEMINRYGEAILANDSTLIATDTDGDALLIEVWGRSAQGTSFVEVAAAKGIGTDSGHSVVFDIKMGAVPPILSFSTAVVPGANITDPLVLQVFITSDQPLLELKGRVLKL